MAPTISSTGHCPKEYLSLTHKIRKPIVEKLRRDRINNSIEELKALLGPQLLNQQPDSKLEKADILEMTVCLLRQQLQLQTLHYPDTVKQGFSRCTQEDVCFESNNGAQTQSNGAVLKPFHNRKTSSKEDMDESVLSQTAVFDLQTLSKKNFPAKSAPWRPW
ncbi:hypothetical protein ACEWY4_012721 [Coilia grayii]|uniref:BHLH domain-containing protein n=1 Tax=Coilia grayii TaxID=363190 RepID=A0ABD1JU96_9TELE